MKSKSIFLVAVTLVAILGVVWSQQNSPGARYAVVVGNAHYAELPSLKNPENDATDMAAALRGLGFEVALLVDADLVRIEDAVARLGTQLSGSTSSIGFFYYAGHGVQSNGTNYLIPADARIVSDAYLKIKALAAQSVLDVLQGAGNSLNVVVLDACRDNPFGWARSGARGLSVVGTQPPGSIVVYATSAGSTAQDGAGRNGVFTTELLKNIALPGVEINEVFKKTGAGVQEATLGKQTPAVYNQFFGDIYLAGVRSGVSSLDVQQPALTPRPQTLILPQSPLKTAEMIVTADRVGAEVLADGIKLGTTPNLFSGIAAGKKIVIQVRQGNYAAEKTVTLNEGETRELFFQLAREKGRLYIKVANPESYTLILNGKNQGKLGASGLVNNVDAGNLDVELVGDGLYWNAQVQVKAGNETTVVSAIPWLDEIKAPTFLQLIFVAGGTFIMGSNDGESDEKPTHSVTVSSFLIGKYEVTQEQYRIVMGTNPSKFLNGIDAAKRPVEQVSWYDAVNFCNKVSDMQGLHSVYTIKGSNITADFSKNGYRLPTEAEWEYAARGGVLSQSYKYSGSNDLDTVAWCEANSNNISHKVGTKAPNELGIYDMCGNVWELCWDTFGTYEASSQIDPIGVVTDGYRVGRGGGWNYSPCDVRISYRNYYSARSLYNYLGFRVVRRP